MSIAKKENSSFFHRKILFNQKTLAFPRRLDYNRRIAFEKGQIPAKMLAKEILGTSSLKEINELVDYIESQKAKAEQQAQMTPMAQAAVKG